MNRNPIKILQEYLEKDPFSQNDWAHKNLTPSPTEVIDSLNEAIKQIVDFLIKNLEAKNNKREFNKLVIEQLTNISLDRFDTEERELLIEEIIELFDKIGHKQIINKWLDPITPPVIKDYNTIQIIKQRCLKCSANLSTWIFEQDLEYEYPYWEIAKCNECAKLNLVVIENAKSFQPNNFEIVKSLKKLKHSKEDAIRYISNIEVKK